MSTTTRFAALLALAGSLVALAPPAAAGLITSAGDAALTGSTLIDFNSEGDNTYSTRTFGGLITLSAPQGSFNVDSYDPSYYPGMSGTYITTRNYGGALEWRFGAAVSAFGFNWFGADQSWTIDLFDSSDSLIETLSISAQTAIGADFLGASGAAISRVLMTPSAFDLIFLDDFRYVVATQSVPEPSTLAIAVLSLGLLGAARRRRMQHRRTISAHHTEAA